MCTQEEVQEHLKLYKEFKAQSTNVSNETLVLETCCERCRAEYPELYANLETEKAS